MGEQMKTTKTKYDITKSIKAISKIISPKTKGLIPTNRVMDTDKCCMILDLQGKDVLKLFNNEHDTSVYPFFKTLQNDCQRINLNINYLKKIINLMETETEQITLFVKDDHPILVKGNRFCCILAPRIDENKPEKNEELKTIIETLNKEKEEEATK